MLLFLNLHNSFSISSVLDCDLYQLLIETFLWSERIFKLRKLTENKSKNFTYKNLKYQLHHGFSKDNTQEDRYMLLSETTV